MSPTDSDCYWPRAFLHVGLFDFITNIERRDQPTLREQPLAVVIDDENSKLIACSDDARSQGVEPGMDARAALLRCASLVLCAARPDVYMREVLRIRQALVEITADIKTHESHASFCLDITHRQQALGTPERIARRTHELVHDATDGLNCSIGVASARLVARYAASLNSHGTVVIAPWDTSAFLQDTPIERIFPVDATTLALLNNLGAQTCGEVVAIPRGKLEARLGVHGNNLWLACTGREPDEPLAFPASPDDIGYRKVLPPRTTSGRVIETYLRSTCKRIATRMCKLDIENGRLHIAVQLAAPHTDFEATFDAARGDTRGIRVCREILMFFRTHWQGEPVTGIDVRLSPLRHASGQIGLFFGNEARLLT